MTTELAELLDPELLVGVPISTASPSSSTRSGVLHAWQHEYDSAGFIVPDLGQCPGHAVDVDIILDQSPSMAGAGGNDPLSRRHFEIRAVLRRLAQSCRCGRERVSLVPFDQPPDATVIGTAMDRRGSRRLGRALDAVARCSTSSSLGPALDIAERVIARARIGRGGCLFGLPAHRHCTCRRT